MTTNTVFFTNQCLGNRDQWPTAAEPVLTAAEDTAYEFVSWLVCPRQQ